MSDDSRKNEELEELFSGKTFNMEQEKTIFRDAKRKSYLRIGAISFGIGILFIILIVLVKLQVAPYLLARRIVQVENQYEVQGANLHLSSWNESRNFGTGSAVAARYKLVEGVPVYEGTVKVPGNNRYQIVREEVDIDWLDNQYRPGYTPYGSKVMQFLWPQAEYEKQIMDFDKVKKLRTGEAAELGISFDRAYSYAEIKSMLPENVDLVWCWVDVPEGESDGTKVSDRGLVQDEADVYGFSIEDNVEEAMIRFSKIMQSDMKKEITADSKSLAGIVVTGSRDELMQVENLPYVRAASLGAVVSIY